MPNEEDKRLLQMKLALADLIMQQANIKKEVRKKLSVIDDRIEFLKKNLMEKMF